VQPNGEVKELGKQSLSLTTEMQVFPNLGIRHTRRLTDESEAVAPMFSEHGQQSEEQIIEKIEHTGWGSNCNILNATARWKGERLTAGQGV